MGESLATAKEACEQELPSPAVATGALGNTGDGRLSPSRGVEGGEPSKLGDSRAEQTPKSKAGGVGGSKATATSPGVRSQASALPSPSGLTEGPASSGLAPLSLR